MVPYFRANTNWCTADIRLRTRIQGSEWLCSGMPELQWVIRDSSNAFTSGWISMRGVQDSERKPEVQRTHVQYSAFCFSHSLTKQIFFRERGRRKEKKKTTNFHAAWAIWWVNFSYSLKQNHKQLGATDSWMSCGSCSALLVQQKLICGHPSGVYLSDWCLFWTDRSWLHSIALTNCSKRQRDWWIEKGVGSTQTGINLQEVRSCAPISPGEDPSAAPEWFSPQRTRTNGVQTLQQEVRLDKILQWAHENMSGKPLEAVDKLSRVREKVCWGEAVESSSEDPP